MVRVFSLISIVARTWALLKFGSAFLDQTSLPAPYQLTVALQRTRGALLGNVGEGWAEPMSHENSVGGCADEHLLWHLELETWPDEEEQRVIAFKIGDRVEDAWGVVQRRYLAHRGDRIGHLDVRQVPE